MGLIHQLTWINSGHISDRSPTIPPWTWASATPNAALIMHTPMNGPIPPLPEVATSNYNMQVWNVRFQTLMEEKAGAKK